MNKILVLFGTRPEAIKMAPVFKALPRRNKALSILSGSGRASYTVEINVQLKHG